MNNNNKYNVISRVHQGSSGQVKITGINRPKF